MTSHATLQAVESTGFMRTSDIFSRAGRRTSVHYALAISGPFTHIG